MVVSSVSWENVPSRKTSVNDMDLLLHGCTLREKAEWMKRKVRIQCRLCKPTCLQRPGKAICKYVTCKARLWVRELCTLPQGIFLLWLCQGDTCSANLPQHCYYPSPPPPAPPGAATWPLSSEFESHCTKWFLKFRSGPAPFDARIMGPYLREGGGAKSESRFNQNVIA